MSIPTAIVGYGSAARVFHAPVIQAVPGLHLQAAVRRSGEPVEGLAIYRSLDDLLAGGAVRLAVIATPNPTHAEIARRCLEAGLHVVVDKPFAVTHADALALADLAQARGLILSVHHNRRWDSDFLTIRRLIDAAVLGRIVMFESSYDRYRPERRPNSWRERNDPGSGILYDLGSHLIDQALVLFGEPERIRADVRIERDDAVIDDAFDLTFEYPRLRVHLRASMLAASPRPRFRVYGTDAAFEITGLDPQEERLKAGLNPWCVDGPAGIVTTREHEWRLPSERGDYRKFYENVRDAIEGKAPLAVTAQHAARVIRIIESCLS